MYTRTGVSVKFLMVWETNSMVGYHLMAEDHSIQFGVWGAMWASQQVQGSALMRVQIFLKKFLNIGHKRMFEKLKIDTF